MADFRRWMTALAVMALFVGLASAQVGTTTGTNYSTFSCSVINSTVTPNLRAEGFTEQTGDIVLICSGGTPLAYGTAIPTVNITVYYNVPAVTSRLMGNVSGVSASEALLLIDEPNNGASGSQSGYGPGLPQMVCNSPAYGAGSNGCTQVVGTSIVNNVPTGGVAVQTTSTGAPTSFPGANVFQGIVSGSSVTFAGVPILPPVTSGLSRVYRITNVRVNANGAGTGVAGVGQVNASISISGATSVPISNPNPIVGYINTGLGTSVSGASTFPQCNSTTAISALLNYQEKFGTAFKTRVDGAKGGASNNYANAVTMNVPGTAFNAESNFVLNGANQGTGLNTLSPTISGSTYTAGLADYGTRLKAVFSNVPQGVNVYVSTTNVSTSTGSVTGVQQYATTSTPNLGTTTATSYAVLLSSETATDSGGLPTQSYTNTFIGTSSSGNAAGYVQYYGVTSQGSPIAFTWEVVNTQPTYMETISFSVFVSYSGVTQSFPPAPTTAQVAMSYAPNPTNGAFSASSGGTTSVNSLIPRFADTSSNSTFMTINLCRTTLLFPYVTTLTGFTTGIEIANTTTDPNGSTQQQGTCTLNWYQGSGNPSPTVTPIIPTGTIYVADSSATGLASSGFNGYMIAVCNFQLAHGAAVIQDVGAQRIMTTYLALIIPNQSSRSLGAGANAEQLNN